MVQHSSLSSIKKQGDHSNNGTCPKSTTSQKIRKIVVFFYLTALVATSGVFVSCNDDKEKDLLLDGADFILTYTGEDQTDGKNINETVGIKYECNTCVSALYIAISDVKFVGLSEEEYHQIKTKSILKRKFDFNVTQYGFTNILKPYYPIYFKPAYFIAKNGSNYFLVQLTSMELADENSQATFSYKF